MELKVTLMDDVALSRAIKRLSHEIIEKNNGVDDVVLIGIKTRGITLAKIIQKNLLELEGKQVAREDLDITLYRDDLSEIGEQPTTKDTLSVELKNKIVIICDDVLYTGRTARAAIDAILNHGRPRCIQLAVVVDRGHREIPIRPDFVGKNIPTNKNELIAVKFKDNDGLDRVDLYNRN